LGHASGYALAALHDPLGRAAGRQVLKMCGRFALKLPPARLKESFDLDEAPA
jgi:hypothetical protein